MKKYKISKCCPDKDLAFEEGFIQIHGSLPMIVKNGNDLWDMDYCPFCGEEVTTSPVNIGVKNNSSKQTVRDNVKN